MSQKKIIKIVQILTGIWQKRIQTTEVFVKPNKAHSLSVSSYQMMIYTSMSSYIYKYINI